MGGAPPLGPKASGLTARQARLRLAPTGAGLRPNSPQGTGKPPERRSVFSHNISPEAGRGVSPVFEGQKLNVTASHPELGATFLMSSLGGLERKANTVSASKAK